MCICFTPAWVPKGTTLVLAPLSNPAGRWFLTYVNSAENQRKSTDAASPMLMVVPVPNPGDALGEMDFLLGATKEVTKMLTAARNGFQPYAAAHHSRKNVKSKGVSRSLELNSMLKVQDVGQYNVTVAPSLQRLLADVPWDRFDVGAAERDAILADMSRKFGSEFAFVVAQTKPGQAPNDSGFGVVFGSPTPFWPTVHEVQLGADGATEMPARMDVTLIGINCVPDRDSCRRAVFTQIASEAGPGVAAEWHGLPVHAAYAVLADGCNDDLAALPDVARSKQVLARKAAGGPKWEDHAKAPAASVEDLGPPDSSPGGYSVEDSAITGVGLTPRWRHVLTMRDHLPTKMVNSDTPIEYEVPRMACSWSLGAGHTAPLYANTNVTGRRCTDADVERLRATIADTVAPTGKGAAKKSVGTAKTFKTAQSMAAELNARLARAGAELETA